MLRFLRIRSLAVIDSVDVEFEAGLNVLTGETGAGKSILVEAVGLLLGGRASGDLVRTGERAAAIEAVFEAAEGELLVRREITAEGRSRAYIDGELATAGALRDLADRLIELHGQHEHQILLDPASHVLALDTYGHLEPLIASTRAAWETFRGVGDELARTRAAARDRATRQELADFHLNEIDRVGPRPGEDEELAVAKQVLASAARVERLCAESYAALYERDGAVLAELGGVWRRVAELAALDPQFHPYVEARDGIKAQLEDLALTLRSYASGIEASPARLQQVEERLAALERLKRKHGPTLADVIARGEALRQELRALESSEEQIAALERSVTAARDAYRQQAASLSAARRRVGADFSRRLEEQLRELAMERARVEIRFADAPDREDEWGASGYDRAEVYLSPNPGEELRPLARIVSGGELSRIMLAVKMLTVASRLGETERDARPPGLAPPGLVFDEIDAGIGGRVADIVGRKLRALGSAFQVLCITHLPQIAAAADAHFLIEKRVDGGRTRATVTRLGEAARVDELGRMLGGADVTDAIRRSAREMLASRRTRAAAGESDPEGESESRRQAKAKTSRSRRSL